MPGYQSAGKRLGKALPLSVEKTLSEHLADIHQVVDYALTKDMDVNLYLEDWSNGIKDSPEYVFELMDDLKDSGIKRFMLPDTLGILNPLQVIEYMRKMKSGILTCISIFMPIMITIWP